MTLKNKSSSKSFNRKFNVEYQAPYIFDWGHVTVTAGDKTEAIKKAKIKLGSKKIKDKKLRDFRAM